MSKTVLGCIVAVGNTALVALLIWRGVDPGWPLAAIIGGGYLFAGMLIDPEDFRGVADKLPSFGKKADE